MRSRVRICPQNPLLVVEGDINVIVGEATVVSFLKLKVFENIRLGRSVKQQNKSPVYDLVDCSIIQFNNYLVYYVIFYVLIPVL